MPHRLKLRRTLLKRMINKSEFYSRLDLLIKKFFFSPLHTRGKLILCPLGEVGLEAKHILEGRYGYSPIIIDDELAHYNPEVMSIDQFKKEDDANSTIIICESDPSENLGLVRLLKGKGICARIENILSLPVTVHPKKEPYFKTIKGLLQVQKAVGLDLVRFRRHNDGGYVLLDDFHDYHVAYSLGINDDISWGKDIAAHDIDVYCYDHTINALPESNPKLHFNKIGIGSTDSLGTSLLSLSTILTLNRHGNETGMIMKMDVERAEWDVIRSVPTETLERFSQITFDFHHVANPDFLT